MSLLPHPLLQSLVANRDVICILHHEQLLRQRDAVKATIPPPILAVLDAAITCLRPLPPAQNPHILRRAQYRVLAAVLFGLPAGTEAAEIRAFVEEFFTPFTDFATILRECERDA